MKNIKVSLDIVIVCVCFFGLWILWSNCWPEQQEMIHISYFWMPVFALIIIIFIKYRKILIDQFCPKCKENVFGVKS